MMERGLSVDHTTIYRWVMIYAPQIEKKTKKHLRATNDSWRVDETYIKVKGKWKYLYRAVDSNGSTLDFMLSSKRDRQAAKRFLNSGLNIRDNFFLSSIQHGTEEQAVVNQPIVTNR